MGLAIDSEEECNLPLSLLSRSTHSPFIPSVFIFTCIMLSHLPEISSIIYPLEIKDHTLGDLIDSQSDWVK